MKSLLAICLLASMPLGLSGVTHQVDMVGLTFVPDTLIISQGDSVRWVNTSIMVHTTTSGVNGVPNGYWDSGFMSPNDSFAFHFDSVGAFPYYCTLHWTLGMVGLITVSPTGVEEFGLTLPRGFTVGQAYPNPSNQVVRIDYSLEVPGRLRFSVYNAAGQKIRSLVDATLAGGEYNVAWDGRDAAGSKVAAGIYFVRVMFGDNKIERKVLLLR